VLILALHGFTQSSVARSFPELFGALRPARVCLAPYQVDCLSLVSSLLPTMHTHRRLFSSPHTRARTPHCSLQQSAQHTAPIAFLASVAASAAQPGDHTLSIDTLPSTAQLHTWLSETLSSETVTLLLSGRHGRVLHRSPTAYLAHYHNQPANSSHLQQKLSKTATTTLFDAQLNQARSENDKATLALLQSTSSGHAWTWKQVLPTENAHRLNDEHYRIAARRDLGLPPISGVMPDVCVACQAEITNNPYHGMQCRQTKRLPHYAIMLLRMHWLVRCVRAPLSPYNRLMD
jgi:hypothetical protein